MLEARSPQAPKDSTNRGIQLQPSSSQILEFSRSYSVVAAAEPASEKISGFSEEDMERSKAAGLPLMHQLLTKMSAGHYQLPTLG